MNRLAQWFADWRWAANARRARAFRRGLPFNRRARFDRSLRPPLDDLRVIDYPDAFYETATDDLIRAMSEAELRKEIQP